MFTLSQIKAAHAAVKSGADFPKYVQDLILLGVKSYETYVMDGHTQYFGEHDYQISSQAVYAPLTVKLECNTEQFMRDLVAHQAGKTDYSTFCKDCAKSGVEKWVVNMADMSCTYFDQTGNIMLTEAIPQ